MIPRKIQKVGHSLGITIPVGMLRYIKAGPGDYVDLSLTESRKIIIEKRGNEEPVRSEKEAYDSPKEFYLPGSGWIPKR